MCISSVLCEVSAIVSVPSSCSVILSFVSLFLYVFLFEMSVLPLRGLRPTMILLVLLLHLLLFPLFHCGIWLSAGQVGREEI